MNLVFLAIQIVFVIPLACIADCLATYRSKVEETWFLFRFLRGQTTKEKRRIDQGECGRLIRYAVWAKADRMVIRKVDFQLGKMNVELTKFMELGIEETITIPSRFEVTNESLFLNFPTILRGCEKYEAVYFQLTKNVNCNRFKPKEMEPILHAFKSCFPTNKIYKMKIEEHPTFSIKNQFVTIKAAEIAPAFGNCFQLVFEYS